MPDAEFAKFFSEITNGKTLEERKAAFAQRAGAHAGPGARVPFGTLTKVQAVRTNVENFRPFRIPRMSNVWLKN